MRFGFFLFVFFGGLRILVRICMLYMAPDLDPGTRVGPGQFFKEFIQRTKFGIQ